MTRETGIFFKFNKICFLKLWKMTIYKRKDIVYIPEWMNFRADALNFVKCIGRYSEER